jgi:hypothetical protein
LNDRGNTSVAGLFSCNIEEKTNFTVAMMEDDDGEDNHVVVVVVGVVVMELVASTCTILWLVVTISYQCENLVDS